MPSLNYKIIRTEDELRKAMESLTAYPVIGLDTETTDLDPYTSRLRLIQLATPSIVHIVDLGAFAADACTCPTVPRSCSVALMFRITPPRP